MFRIEVIVPEKYLLKGFLEVAYNASIVLKKIEISAPKLNHSHHDEKTGIGAAHCMKKGTFFREKFIYQSNQTAI